MLGPTRRRLAALAAALLLAAPAPALAQSAGDDQYEDPFAGQNEEQPAPAATPAPAEPAPAEPAPAPSEPAPVEPAAESTPVPVAQEPGAEPAELPRTGLDAGPVLAIGTVLLAGGLVLRLRLRERA
jgi:2-oxoglutarate dehydrogenase E2 component (dihydrolipoamide succinyltransferase)